MNLTCPACGAPFSADDVHAELGIANCRVCRGVLDLRGRDRPLDRPRPPRFVVDESDGRLQVSWRWFRAAKLLLFPFAIFWWSILAVFITHVMLDPKAPLIARLFPLGHVAAGVVVVYIAFANVLNRTRVIADDGGITVSHGPLPWLGKRVERASLQQLFCESVPGKNSVTFALVAVDEAGSRTRLIGGFSDDSEPRWLEAALEKRLDIRNRPVPGELPRA